MPLFPLNPQTFFSVFFFLQDTVFILDSSTSVDEAEFEIGKNFIADFVDEDKNIVIGPGDSEAKVGVITYGRVVVPELDLTRSAELGMADTVAEIRGKS